MIDLAAYGYQPIEEPGEGILPARVIAVHRERCELICAHGPVFGRLKTGIYYGPEAVDFPATGDFVLLQYVQDGDSVIVKTLPRRSVFVRSDYSGHKAGYAKTILEQAVAANFDTCFIMSSLNQNFNPARLERYLTLAWQSGAEPVILLTKSDLLDDFTEQVQAAREIAMGVEVIALSAVTGFGLEQLDPYLRSGRTVVFLGSSGVGKSSLLNALMGETAMAVKEIREGDSRGKHTTTHRQLFMLPSGAMVIDTPGMREIGMWDVSTGLGTAFADVEEVLARLCKFSDCKHESEPGCAVKAALENGELSAERLESYRRLKREARWSDDPEGALREKWARDKAIAQWNRLQNQKKKKGGRV